MSKRLLWVFFSAAVCLIDKSTAVAAEGRRVSFSTNYSDSQQLEASTSQELATTTPTTTAPTIAVPADRSFKFTNIYLIGGTCNDTGDSASWYSKLMLAGKGTLGDRLTKWICCTDKNPDIAYGEEFHVEAFQEVQQLAGDNLNTTLVITGNVQNVFDTAWNILTYLTTQKGMAYIGCCDAYNHTKYNLTTDQFSILSVRADDSGGPELAGRELCRLRGTSAHLKVAKYYLDWMPDLNIRVDGVIEAFQRECEKEVEVVWEYFEMEEGGAPLDPKFLLNPLPDVVLTVNDEQAEKVLNTAKRILSTSQYDRLITTGWDHTRPKLVEQQKIIMSVDQMVFYEHLGYWRTVEAIMNAIQDGGLRSTAEIQQALGIPKENLFVKSNALLVSSDSVGYLLSSLLDSYDTRAAPSQEVKVHTGLYDATIVKFAPFEGYFEAVLWMRWSWYDQRLAWDEFTYKHPIKVDKGSIWTPQIFFKNELESTKLFEAPAILKYGGQVTLDVNLKIKFLCSTTYNLRSFPFDVYSCSIDMAGYEDLNLDSSLGFEVIESDAHFEYSTNTSNTTTQQNVTQGLDNADQTVHYHLYFKRSPFTAYVRLILPAVIINMIGFMAFWIPDAAESVALGITSLLCTIAYRETVTMPDTSDVTWTEVFMMINIAYQAAVMFIIFLSYNYVMRKKIRAWNEKVSAMWQEKRLERLKRQAERLGHSAQESLKQQARESKQILRMRRKKDDDDSFIYDDSGDEMEFEVKDSVEDEEEVKEAFPDDEGGQLRRRKLGTSEKRRLQSSVLTSISESSAYSSDEHAGTYRDSIPSLDVPLAMPPANLIHQDDSSAEESHANVDWIGRWFVVPSYIVVMMTLFLGGWGFFIENPAMVAEEQP